MAGPSVRVAGLASSGHHGSVPVRRRSSLRAPIALVALLLAAARRSPRAPSATEFPAGKTGYHSYTEVAADVAAVAAAHPAIV